MTSRLLGTVCAFTLVALTNPAHAAVANPILGLVIGGTLYDVTFHDGPVDSFEEDIPSNVPRTTVGTNQFPYTSFSVSPVPIPAAVWLFGSGLNNRGSSTKESYDWSATVVSRWLTT